MAPVVRLLYDTRGVVTMSEDVSKDIQIHIHEHVGPIRERLGRIEGRLDVNEREITLLRQGLNSLRDSINATKDTILQTFSDHEEEQWIRYNRVEMSVQSLRNWMIGITVGAAAIWAILEFLIKAGIFVLHGG